MVYALSNTSKDKEEKILRFIKDRRGCNKQDVVDYASNKGISSRNTTWNILDNLEKQNIIRLTKSKPNSRDYKIELIEDNPISNLYKEINLIKQSFDSLIDKFLEEGNNLVNINASAIECNTKLKVISLFSCILKLITSIMFEILIYHLSKIVKDKDNLVKEYNYFYIKMSELNLSFDNVKKLLDERLLDSISFFAQRNNTPIKTFLWSVMIFYEARSYPYLFIYTKEFKSQLFSLMSLIYNTAKKYSSSVYEEIVYDTSTHDNHIVRFPSTKYVQPLIDELSQLDYKDFIRLLIERCNYINSIYLSDAVKSIKEIEIDIGKKTFMNMDNICLSIFEQTIYKVMENLELSQNTK